MKCSLIQSVRRGFRGCVIVRPTLAVLVALVCADAARGAAFTPGNLAILRFGDGSAALTSAGAAVFIDEYTTNGSLVQTLAIPPNGPTALVVSGTATSEGALMRSPNGRYLCFAGYNAAAGTLVVNATATAVPRELATMDITGTYAVAAKTTNSFNMQNIRSGATDGVNNFWGSGSGSGTYYFGLPSPATVQNTIANTRVNNIQNGNLYFSTASGTATRGIHCFTGTPTGTNTATQLIATGNASSPYGFAINPGGTIAYVADDTGNVAGGIQRWINSGGTWSLTYTLGTGVPNVGARSLVVDWSGTDPVLYATTSEATATPNRLIKITDTGAGSPAATLTSVLPNQAFRGVAFVPDVPPVLPPVIFDFSPHEGGEGTLLTINGLRFGNNPDNLCVVLTTGNRFIDVEVLTATPTQLVARVGVIPPANQGQPLQLMLGTGDGARADLCPAFPDVTVAPDNWIWRGDQINATVAAGFFLAVPTTQPAGMVNFHSGAPANGMLMVTLNADWGIGSRYCISARIHAAGTGADTRIGPATFTGNGTRFDCAQRICDLLIKAFASHPQRPLTILCTVTTNGGNAVITMKLPVGVNIDSGNIDIVQKEPPPVITGLWDLQNAGLWRKEVRKREIARWYRCAEWTTASTIWFERRAEGLWITKQAVETFSYNTHCIYRFPNGNLWVIWRTFTRTDLVRFWTHYRFWWPGRVNPLLPADNPAANRTMMSMDEVQFVLPMTPADPNPGTPVNEAVMIVDENGVQHFQGEPGFEIPPDITGNPNGFQLVTTAQSTSQLPPAADRIQDVPMQPMPGMANLQPGVIIQWLVSANGTVMVDHDTNGWPDSLTSPHVLGGQKHQGLIAPPTGTAGTELPVDQGNNQLQLYCWELDPTGEVRGAAPGQVVIGPPADLNGDGVVDGPIGAPVPSDPTVRQLVVFPGGIQEQQDPTGKPVDVAVVEAAAPTDAQLAAMNANLAAQIPGFVPLQRPFILCMSKIHVRRIWTVDRRFVFDIWLHHWAWQHRNHIVLTHRACRVWLTKVSVSQFSSARHCYQFGLPPTWQMYDLTQVRFLRVCLRVITVPPNQVAFKIDQMHVVVPADPNNPNSQLMLLSTQGDENKLFQEVPPPVLAGLQPDPLPVGPDGVFIEPIDPVAGVLDVGLGGAGVFDNRPLEARGMLPATLDGNEDAANAPENNQLQLYCWALNPNGTIAQETFTLGGFSAAGGAPQPVTLAMTPTPALPAFEDENGNAMDNPTMFITTLTGADNTVNIVRNANGTATISWEGPGQLQFADELLGNGPPTVWTDVPGGATSPVAVSANQVKRFYRLRR